MKPEEAGPRYFSGPERCVLESGDSARHEGKMKRERDAVFLLPGGGN